MEGYGELRYRSSSSRYDTPSTQQYLQQWNRNVKSSRFVTTLRDYFLEKFRSEFNISVMWALKYVDMAWLRPISEAMDADSSGYITVGEINHFTDACPKQLGWRYTYLLLLPSDFAKIYTVFPSGSHTGHSVSSHMLSSFGLYSSIDTNIRLASCGG